ncbi:MAG: RsmG family class I SAM-dependent methyltransferase [Acidobacteriota bacterium]
MAAPLPHLDRDTFAAALRDLPAPMDAARRLPDAALTGLHAHYEALRRWNRQLSLVGPGTADDVIARHYGEALAGLDWLNAMVPRASDARAPATLVDLGSGGGFPGLVLALARPDLRVFLVEARQRKWSFLSAAARAAQRAGADCAITCINARVDADRAKSAAEMGLPPSPDVIVCRAVRIDARLLGPFEPRPAHPRLLLWAGADPPPAPPPYRPVRHRALPGADARVLWWLAPEAVRLPSSASSGAPADD